MICIIIFIILYFNVFWKSLHNIGVISFLKTWQISQVEHFWSWHCLCVKSFNSYLQFFIRYGNTHFFNFLYEFGKYVFLKIFFVDYF